jgi:hypothetical protein
VSAKKDNLRSAEPAASDAESRASRRIGRIVRDDRDTASVEWLPAPPDHQRVPLAIEGTLPPGVKSPLAGYNPYETIAPSKSKPATDKRPVKRDLRKLSAWIKQMRDLAERKKRGDE